MNNTAHSAPGQAAGYEYQRQLALVLLAESMKADPQVAVRLEALEDIDVVSEDESVARNVQAKHHLAEFTLTDRSPELWRTLNVWMGLLPDQAAERMPQLQLATTSVAADKDGVALLGPEARSRDIPEALRKLVAVAKEQGAEATRDIRRRFGELSEAMQLRLLQAATILDASEPVSDLDGRLQEALGMVVPRERPEAFLERIKGWWVGRSVELLTRERESVGAQELYDLCDAVRDDFRRGSLTVTSELSQDPDDAAKQPLLNKPFVRQLRLVRAPDDVTDLAVRHYFRARAQRSRWAREVMNLDADIQAYEDTLTDEWDTAFTGLRAQAPTEEQARSQAGLAFAMEFGTHTRAVLRGVDDHVLCRGSLHGLADRKEIGWHPDFRELMNTDD